MWCLCVCVVRVYVVCVCGMYDMCGVYVCVCVCTNGRGGQKSVEFYGAEAIDSCELLHVCTGTELKSTRTLN